MENYEVSIVRVEGGGIVTVDDPQDRKALTMLNPDYVRMQVLEPRSHKQMLLKEQTLKATFNQEENAKRWLYSQIMKCVMMTSTVSPEARMVNDFASAIFQLYGNRPITHLAIFFGYAQVGQHYYDEYQMEHYGVFDLSTLLGDLAHHMRVASTRSHEIRKKVEARQAQIKRWSDILEGRVITYDEWFASLSPEEQAQAARINGTRGDDITTEEWQKRKQESLEYARQMLERLKKQEDD